MKEKFTVEVNGVTCEVIATYLDENTNKNYILYTDHTYNDKHQLNVYYGLYEVEQGKFIIKKITSLEDKKIISDVFRSILNTI